VLVELLGRREPRRLTVLMSQSRPWQTLSTAGRSGIGAGHKTQSPCTTICVECSKAMIPLPMSG
jgi:hypothetical protein